MYLTNSKNLQPKLLSLVLALILNTISFAKISDIFSPNNATKPTAKGDTSKFKKYMLGKFWGAHPTARLTFFYGVSFSKLKYKSFDSYRELYKDLYISDLPSFKRTLGNSIGFNFIYSGLGIELANSNLKYSLSFDENINGFQGKREFNLDLNENSMALMIAGDTRKIMSSLSLGFVMGQATLKPIFINSQGIITHGGISYLNGIYNSKYHYFTGGFELGRGYGRVKLVAKYDFGFRQIGKNFKPIKDKNQDFGSDFGPYIPKNRVGYDDSNSKLGLGSNKNYIGSDIRNQKFSIRLIYNIVYWGPTTRRR